MSVELGGCYVGPPGGFVVAIRECIGGCGEDVRSESVEVVGGEVVDGGCGEVKCDASVEGAVPAVEEVGVGGEVVYVVVHIEDACGHDYGAEVSHGCVALGQ